MMAQPHSGQRGATSQGTKTGNGATSKRCSGEGAAPLERQAAKSAQRRRPHDSFQHDTNKPASLAGRCCVGCVWILSGISAGTVAILSLFFGTSQAFFSASCHPPLRLSFQVNHSWQATMFIAANMVKDIGLFLSAAATVCSSALVDAQVAPTSADRYC